MSANTELVVMQAEDNPRLKLSARVVGSPKVSGGSAGWEAVPRLGRRPLVAWRGASDPLTLTLTLMLDGWFDSPHEGYSVEDDIRTIERMAGLDEGDPRPPELAIEGGIPHDFSRSPQTRWVIAESPEWGDDVIRRSDGHRVRQDVTLTLWAITSSERLSGIRRKTPAPTFGFIRSHKDDTFARIAARELGLRRAGSRLARLNGRRDPNQRLPEGTLVRKPTAATLRRWRTEMKGS